MFPFDAVEGRVTGAGQPVTSGGAGEQDADTPDDGSRLVYRTTRGGQQQVWARNVVDNREGVLAGGDGWNRTRPRWSADGTRVAYLKRRGTVTGTNEGAVAILYVDRGEEQLLTKPGSPELIPSDWSADGKWLLGGCPQPSSRRVGTCVIDVVESTEPSGSIRVVAADPHHNLFEQRFSPNQRWISFMAVNATDAGVSTIHVMPGGGGSWTPITDGKVYDDKPHWAPDGRTIYFVSPRDGVLNVWGRRFDPQTGTPYGNIFQVTSFNSPRQMISSQLSAMQIAVTASRLFLPITETQSELWMLENVDR
jgi:Tol biopolymer transport system component